MAYKPIFLIGTTYGKNATIPKGINGSRRLIQHSLRIAKVNQDFVKSQTQVSNIDLVRIKSNLFYSSKTNDWRVFRDKQHRQQVMEWFNKKLDKSLEPIKTEFEVKKKNRIQTKKEYGRYSTFTEYLSKKQPMAEWILSGSKEWFQHNNVIKINPEKLTSFEILNHKKLIQWADTVQTWAKGQIENFYGKDAFVMSNLHLDEGNVHIHFNFMRRVYKWNEKENKMSWGLTNEGFIDREKIKRLHQSYRQYQNKILFNELNWEKTYTLEKTQSGVKYLRLLEYKTAQSQKNLEQINHELEKNQYLQENKMFKPNQEIVKEAERILHKGVVTNNYELINVANEMLLNQGIHPYDIEDIQHEIRREL